MRNQSDDDEYGKKLFGKIVVSSVTMVIAKLFFPKVIPFNVFDFWKSRGSLWEWLAAAWPIFAWASVVTLILCLWHNKPNIKRPADILIGGTVISLFAGVVEEILFRWLFFLSSIVWVKIGNFIFFDFLGFGSGKWIHLNVLGPLANLITLNALEQYLFHSSGWAVGAAMLASNAFFRDGHKYLGWMGWLNSWWLGMFFFWIMFQYGLPAAILCHFLYDLCIYTIAYLVAVSRQA